MVDLIPKDYGSHWGARQGHSGLGRERDLTAHNAEYPILSERRPHGI
jgi:hypothetical protein